MDDNAETATSVVDSALFEDLFKAARRGALNTEPAVAAADVTDWTASAAEDTPAEAVPEAVPEAAVLSGSIDWPAEDPDTERATAARPSPGRASARPQGVAAIRGEPAQTGWRLLLRRGTAGLVRPGPGKAERRLRAARAVLRSVLDRPLTVVFAHPDADARGGGITLRTANAFGAARGGSVLAWSLGEECPAGVPADQEPPAAPLADLVADLDRLRGHTSRLTDLARYTQPQRGGVDVLPGGGAPTGPDPAWFAPAHDLLARFYTVLCVEVGDETPAHAWADAADVLVLCAEATTASVDAAVELAAGLRDAGHGALVDTAIGVVHARAKTPKAVPRMLGERMRRELDSVLTIGRRRGGGDAPLVNGRRPVDGDPVWTFLGASIIDSSVNRGPGHGDRPVQSKVSQS